MPKFSEQPDNPGMTTQTEKLLAEAHALCKKITGREEVNESLLTEVFQRLAYELDMREPETADSIEHVPPREAMH